MSLAQINEIKELMILKTDTYYSRMIDVAANCKHPANIRPLAVNLEVMKSLESLKEVMIKKGFYTIEKEVSFLSEACIEALDKFKTNITAEIKEAEHPYDLVEVSEKLDKLILI